MPLSRPEPLSDAHELDEAFSGVSSLDDWLKRRARANQVSGASRTFVVAAGDKVVGYYALGLGRDFRRRQWRPISPQPGPRALSRLRAARRVCSGYIGIRGIVVHAISGQARAF